jgi:hypothetical protein
MNKIILSCFAFSVVFFSGCAQKDLQCQKNQIQEGEKCISYSLKKMAVVTGVSCSEGSPSNCKEQTLELSMDNAKVVQYKIKNGSHKIGDILEIYIKE